MGYRALGKAVRTLRYLSTVPPVIIKRGTLTMHRSREIIERSQYCTFFSSEVPRLRLTLV